MRKRSLVVETHIGPLKRTKVRLWTDNYGGGIGGIYVPEYGQPAKQVTRIYGYIRTEPSYLGRFNKNNVCHESYSGLIPLKWKNFSTTSSAYQPTVDFLNEHGCIPGKVSYFPMRDNYTVLSDSDKTGLLISYPSSFSSGANRKVWLCGLFFDRRNGTMRGYNADGVSEADVPKKIQRWEAGRLGSNIYNRWNDVPLIKGLDTVPDLDAYLRNIRESLVFYTRDSIFPPYELSLDDALGDAVSHADGFHFSRLAAELALDGLAVQSLQEIIRLMRKAPAKYTGPLKKLMAVLKVLPSAYLGLQYGVLAPLREYASLPGALQQQFEPIEYSFVGTSVSTFEDFNVQTRVALQAREPTDQKSLFELTYLLRGGLSLDDLWEVVPLSFVVDWFVNLGALAESTRFNEIYSKLDIQYATVSRSYERVVTLDINGMQVDVNHRIYTREYRKADSLPSHIFSFTWGDLKGSWSVSNVDEAASMILSYLL